MEKKIHIASIIVLLIIGVCIIVIVGLYRWSHWGQIKFVDNSIFKQHKQNYNIEFISGNWDGLEVLVVKEGLKGDVAKFAGYLKRISK